VESSVATLHRAHRPGPCQPLLRSTSQVSNLSCMQSQKNSCILRGSGHFQTEIIHGGASIDPFESSNAEYTFLTEIEPDPSPPAQRIVSISLFNTMPVDLSAEMYVSHSRASGPSKCKSLLCNQKSMEEVVAAKEPACDRVCKLIEESFDLRGEERIALLSRPRILSLPICISLPVPGSQHSQCRITGEAETNSIVHNSPFLL